jgi:hypothetical protein
MVFVAVFHLVAIQLASIIGVVRIIRVVYNTRALII